MDHHAVAHQPHRGTAAHQPLGHIATGHLAQLADAEDLEDLGAAEENFALDRAQHAGQLRFDFVDQVVDDRVISDVDARATGELPRLDVGAHVEADHQRLRRGGEADVGFVDAADSGVQHIDLHILALEIFQAGGDRFRGAVGIGLDDDGEFGHIARGRLGEHVFDRGALGDGTAHGAFAPLPVFRDLARPGLVLDDGEIIAGKRRRGEPEHLDRHRRAGLRHVVALVVDQRAHAAPFAAGDHDVADPEGAMLHQHGGDGAAAAVEIGLDHHAFRRAVGVGAQFEDFRLQQDGFLELVQIGLLRRRDLDRQHVAADRFIDQLVLQQFVTHPGRVRIRLIHLVDGDDDRHPGGLGVGDRLDRLRHDAVIGGDHQHDDVGDVGAARAHRGKGGVARGVDEGDLAARREGDLVGTDMLGDAAGLAAHDIGLAQRVQQRCLAVVDMAHHRHHRRTRFQQLFRIGGALETDLDIRLADPLQLVAEFGHHQFGGVRIDRLRHGGHHAELHQHLDHLDAAFGHAVGKLLHGDRFRDDHLADDLDRLHRLALGPSLAFARPPDRSQAADPLLVVECLGDGELAGAAPGLGGTPRAGTAHIGPARPAGAFTLVFLALDGSRPPSRAGGIRRTGSRLQAFGLLQRLARRLFFAALAFLFLAAPAFLVLSTLSFLAPALFFLGARGGAARFGIQRHLFDELRRRAFGFARTLERAGPHRGLFLGQCPQHRRAAGGLILGGVLVRRLVDVVGCLGGGGRELVKRRRGVARGRREAAGAPDLDGDRLGPAVGEVLPHLAGADGPLEIEPPRFHLEQALAALLIFFGRRALIFGLIGHVNKRSSRPRHTGIPPDGPPRRPTARPVRPGRWRRERRSRGRTHGRVRHP